MIAETAERISSLAPPQNVLTGAGTPPDFSAAPQLAKIFGADPGPLLTLGKVIAKDVGTIAKAVQMATPLLASALKDLIALVQRFIAEAARLIAQALVPNPATAAAALAQLAALPGKYISAALARAAQLETELAPATALLRTVGTTPLEFHGTPVHDGDATTAEKPRTVAMELSSSTAAAPKALQAVEKAKSQLGTPYVWGGQAPGRGFDCSGLVQWAYRESGVELPRTAAAMAMGSSVPQSALQPGDLAVWSGHVAMCIGDGKMIEAGDPVQINPVRTTNMGMPFKGFFRPTA
ncbi:C40 family peptidase [Corynebacterium glucuronolyticum]|uniref:C40 family peptidase n=1 Tax=Corynebacterium glucuronolyticum TaxID=39791 RepID=UPI00019C1BAD|nr:C40 family peptidase [Corynebacterium glucuronolyticum]EEI28379.1 NlpC/P60 family protein [Corynebacterium glucuronolyticum ATCC 51867]QRO81625.1 C40 family peptidase [Corynebacterium glucuronolyticum]